MIWQKLKIMKKMLMVMVIASVFASCKSDPSDLQTNKVLLTDSSGINNSSASSDTGTAVQKGVKPAAVSKSSSSSSNKTSTSTSTTKSGNNASSGNETTTTTTTTTTAKKKGWSSRAKGAVIGGVAGAVGGAIIDKKHPAAGAAIGGVVGAAGGYIIGNEKDKKNNR